MSVEPAIPPELVGMVENVAAIDAPAHVEPRRIRCPDAVRKFNFEQNGRTTGMNQRVSPAYRYIEFIEIVAIQEKGHLVRLSPADNSTR